MANDEKIAARITELLGEGRQWLSTGDKYHAASGVVGWLTSVAHLVESVGGSHGRYASQARDLSSKPGNQLTSRLNVEQMLGLLTSFKTDFDRGLLRSLEYVVVGETFDEFLDRADGYCRAGKKIEGSILVSAVFEDGVRKLAAKHSLDRDKKMELLIDDLVRAEVLTPVAGRRCKVVANLRNYADHADWDKFAVADVEDAVRTTRQIVEKLEE